MRCILAFSVVLAVATPAWAQNNVPSQEPFSQQPSVSTSVPNIQAPGAPMVTTTPSTVVQQGTATAPAGTTYYGNTMVTQPGATTMVPAPAGNRTFYYYYPAGNSGRMFRMTAPATVYSTNSTPVYTTATPVYYTTVRRGFPFGLFRRRFAQPAYTTAAYTTTPTYYSRPGYYTPTTSAIPAGPSPVPAVYTPTTYTVPNENASASTVTPSGTTNSPSTSVPSGSTTSPSTTPPAGTTIPSRTIPAPPPLPR